MMTTQKFKTLWENRRGNALIEFALTFPTLVVITLMIFDLGQALFVYTTVNNAAADGARYAAVHGSESTYAKTSAQVSAWVADRAAGLNEDNMTVTVTYSPGNSSGSEVEVQIDYELNYFLSGVFETITGEIDGSITLTGQSTMTIL